jgi:hypothetical protein
MHRADHQTQNGKPRITGRCNFGRLVQGNYSTKDRVCQQLSSYPSLLGRPHESLEDCLGTLPHGHTSFLLVMCSTAYFTGQKRNVTTMTGQAGTSREY